MTYIVTEWLELEPNKKTYFTIVKNGLLGITKSAQSLLELLY